MYYIYMPRPRAGVSKQQLVQAIHDSLGNVATVARKLGLARKTIYVLLERHQLWDEVKQARETLADMAEEKLIEKIQEGNERLIEFVLKAYRPEIYNPRHQADVAGEVRVRVVYDDSDRLFSATHRDAACEG